MAERARNKESGVLARVFGQDELHVLGNRHLGPSLVNIHWTLTVVKPPLVDDLRALIANLIERVDFGAVDLLTSETLLLAGQHDHVGNLERGGDEDGGVERLKVTRDVCVKVDLQVVGPVLGDRNIVQHWRHLGRNLHHVGHIWGGEKERSVTKEVNQGTRNHWQRRHSLPMTIFRLSLEKSP